MVTLNDSLVSSSARKMPIRKRADLTSRKQYYLGRTYWVVKDPVGLHYYRFQEEEYAILQMLDGKTSLDEIKERFEEQFPPQKITLDELHQFLGMLHRSGLIISSVQGQAQSLLERRRERVRREWMSMAMNILCLRFKGFDPERLLNWLLPKVQWLFHAPAALMCLALMLSAGGLVLVEFDVFRSKLPEFNQFFNAHNAIWLGVVLAVTKVIHEFGHGISCKYYGGECHEMGIMLLVLTPCLYCNVSDSWMLTNKWHRVIIGAAGMYVEMVLASICTFVWWFTEPGLLNNLCLNTMFISSVSTLIFNGNPLLRYDGYYMLADILEIPNLRQKATQILSRKASEWFLGMEVPEDPFLPQRKQVIFALYSVASAVYRWVVVFSILMFLNQFFKQYDLKVIGQMMGLASVAGLFGYPVYQVGKFFYVPGRLEKVKMPRFYASVAGFGALLAAVLFVPLPYHVLCTLEVQARDAAAVYVDVAGFLDKVEVKAGQPVTKGQPLARLTNLDLELEINKLSGMQSQYGMQYENLQQQRFRDPRAGAELPQVTDALRTISDELAHKRFDQARLILKAPVDGTVLPPPLTKRHETSEGQLPAWSGTPLEPENRGAYLEASTLFCQIGNPQQMEAILVIDQADIEFVAADQRVDLKLQELPHNTLQGKISEVANIDLKITPQRLSSKAGGDLVTMTDPDSGIERPMSTSYQARVPLDDPEGLLRIGLRGQGKIFAAKQSLGQRLWRLAVHTFNFRM